jgi:hypothetical protein
MIKFHLCKKNLGTSQFGKNWCFGQFYHPGIEVLQNCSASFFSVSLMRGKFE